MHRMVDPYRRFGTIYLAHLRGSSNQRKNSWTGPLKMEPIHCPETSVREYHSSLHKISKELRSHVHRGRSQKSRKIPFILTGALRVDNCPRNYWWSNRRGRWSWWPQHFQPRISNKYPSNQEIIWVYLPRIFVTVFSMLTFLL